MYEQQQSTLVPDSVRLAISQKEDIGAGNFLATALVKSPAPETPMLFLEVPLQTPWGNYQSLSLKDLDTLSQKYSAWYDEQGVTTSDPVGIYMDDGISYLVHYLALVKLGAIAVLINGRMPPAIVARYCKKVGTVGLFLDSGHHQSLTTVSDPSLLGFVGLNETITKSYEEPQAIPPYSHSNGDPVMIAHSSGTTGIPKAVLLEHDKFFYGIRYRLKFPRLSGGERILSSLPHSHNCAIAYLTLAILSGTPVYIASNHSGRSVLQAIEDFKPTMVVSFPQTYVEMTEQDLDEYDLSSVALWFNGGDAAHETHIRKLVAQGHHEEDGTDQQGSFFVDGMGSSEMGFSLFRNVHTPQSNHYKRCVGQPLEWVEAAVFSFEGKRLTAHQVGRLGVKSPSVTTGYWNDSVLTYKSKCQGFFLTGDLAYFDDEGRFFHVDRIPDMIQTSAGPVYSLLTEEFLMRDCPEISDCSVVKKQDESGDISAIVVVRLVKNAAITRNELKTLFNQILASNGMNLIDDVTVVGSAAIPLGTTGKVLKRELRPQFSSAEVSM